MGALELGLPDESKSEDAPPRLRLVSLNAQAHSAEPISFRESNPSTSLHLPNSTFETHFIRSNDQAPQITQRLHARVSSLTRYDERTLLLLGDYFSGALSKSASAELAGRLVFPHNSRAAQLYGERVRSGKLSEQKEQRLLAEALYPDNPEAAEVAYHKLVGKRTLSLAEQITLYAADAYPDSNRDAQRLKRRLTKELQNAQSQPAEEKASPLREFAKEQITSPISTVSSFEDLAGLFGLSADQAKQILSDPQIGLTTYEHRYREEKQILTTNKHRDALSLCVLKAARNLVSLENELYKSGVINRLSTREDFRKLFGVTRGEIEQHVRFIYTDDLRFRERVFGRQDHQRLKSELASEVERQVEGVRTGSPLTSLVGDEALATKYSLEPAAVYHILHEKLSPVLLQFRQLKLREKGDIQSYLASPTNFVTSELKAFRKGEIEQVSTDRQLAALFGVSESLIYDQLSPREASGLPASSFKDREFSLALQERQDAPTVALRLILTEYLKEQVLRSKNAPTQSPTESSPRLSSTARVSYHGHSFDSIEEAAHALLLEKFIPGFLLQKNETLHVEVGNRVVDFYLPRQHAVVEYHPIKTYWNRFGEGSFRTQEEYQEYIENVKQLKRISQRLAQWYKDAVKNQLLEEYTQERQSALDSWSQDSRPNLIVTTSLEEQYLRVVRPYGKNVPGFEAFKKEFNRLRARIKVAQKKEETPRD
ncbi:MAG: hypothetical protein KDD64_10550 [Bdellovibrionales bacterium]|nr:hypothetical protein [Bdellovibrionales bacterium]